MQINLKNLKYVNKHFKYANNIFQNFEKNVSMNL